MIKICIAIPTKLHINAVTVLSLLNSLPLHGYDVEIKFLPGKSNIDQSRSILVTNWYDSSGDDDLFLFIDSDQTFRAEDIIALINLECDVAVGVYSSLDGRPTCRPIDYEKFLTGESNDVHYGATGFMLIRKPILKKVENFIKLEHMGYSRFWISNRDQKVIPFFTQRLIISETIPSETPIPEWLGEDYGFCWMVQQVKGTIKCHVSPTIGHQVPQIVYFYPDEYNSKKYDNKSIVYYTGNSRITWSPQDVKTKGLGGSETAVYYLTKYWKQMGYNPIVYGNCVEGVYDGVEYYNYSKFSTRDQFNILILWRSYGISVLDKVKAEKILIDLHDKPSPPYQIINDYIEKVDKVMVKSEFHKSLFPENIYNKIAVLQNGVPDYYFNVNNMDKIDKNRYKLIYASEYDRGLYEMLLWGWPLIKQEVPDAELHIYSGMESSSDEFKQQLIPLLNQEGVYEHGKIGQQELMQKKLESSIHYYVGFLLEVDCITIKESALANCIPVVNNYSVFIERDYCLKVDGETKDKNTHILAAKIIIKLLTDDEFYQKSLKFIQEHSNVIDSWKDIAGQWDNYFINNSKVSVILPVYNNEEDVLNSIKSVIDQSYKDWELIVVDDCSTDNSFKLIDDFIKDNDYKNIRLIRNDINRGCYASMNRGILISRGEYITRIDSDDTYHKNKLEKDVNILDNNSDIVATIKLSSRRDSPAEITMMYRKTIFEKIGYFDSVRFGADTEFNNRICKIYGKEKVMFTPEVVYFAKTRENSLTTSNVTGTREIRYDYINKYKNWHNTTDRLYIDYPMRKRPFEVNPIML